MHNHYDIIVVGAGPGGASAAALLAKQGKRVLLVDKNKKAGGRMMTLHRDGFTFEYFPIYCVPIVSSRYEELLKEIKVNCDAAIAIHDPSRARLPQTRTYSSI